MGIWVSSIYNGVTPIIFAFILRQQQVFLIPRDQKAEI